MTLFRIKHTDIAKAPLDSNDEFDKFMSSNSFPERDQTSRVAASFMFGAGLTTPVISVHKSDDASPRAYRTFPRIFIDTNGNFMKKDELLIDVPDGYNNEGKKLIPTIPHEIVPAHEAGKILSGIHGGGWGPMCSVYWVPSHGTALPNNFKMNDTVAKIISYKPSHAFLLNKSNPSIIWDFINVASGRTDRYLDAIKQHVEANNPGYYMNSSYPTDSTSIELTISIRKNGSGTPHSSADLSGLLHTKKNNDYLVSPDTKTKEGKKLQKLLDIIPPTGNSRLSALIFEAISPTQTIVTVPPNTESIPSQLSSLTPISLAAYHWIKDDIDDRAMGVIPPLMPKEIRTELFDLNILNDMSLEPVTLHRLSLS